jgi:hypothetical protein
MAVGKKLTVAVVLEGKVVATVTRTPLAKKHPYENPKLARKVSHVWYDGEYHMVMWFSEKYAHLASLPSGTALIETTDWNAKAH